LQLLVWIASPLLVLQQGDVYASHSGLEEMADKIQQTQLTTHIDIATLNDLDETDLVQFVSLHINITPQDTDNHNHDSYDGCCGFGGLVCDSCIVAIGKQETSHNLRRKYVWDTTLYVSIDVPTLRHPPKIIPA